MRLDSWSLSGKSSHRESQGEPLRAFPDQSLPEADVTAQICHCPSVLFWTMQEDFHPFDPYSLKVDTSPFRGKIQG